MGLFDSMNVSASGMTTERFKMDLIAENIANVSTTRTISGEPYKRQVALVGPALGMGGDEAVPAGFDEELKSSLTGVEIQGVVEDSSPLKPVYDPNHPDAMKDGPYKGYVLMPNVDIITEMTTMIQASRAFEANAAAVEAAKQMANKSLEIGRGGGGGG